MATIWSCDHLSRDASADMAASCGPDWRTRAGKLRRRWEKLQEGGSSGDGVLLKASVTLQRLDEACAEEGPDADSSRCLALYSQAILDVTFFEENQLVDEEFPGDDSLEQVQELLQMMSEPESLLGDGHQNLALDTEFQECLHWRRGALLYMYCHTVGRREKWQLQDSRNFRQCLQDGIQYLLKMLHTRCPVQLDDTVSFQDVNMAALLEKGIFSDIHVLALMYCGEMCYWVLSYCRDMEQTSPHSKDLSQELHFKDIGEKVLDTYVTVCEGVLRGQGWSTDNAKKILQCLKEGTV